jgi:hypothetical protein
MSGGGIQRLSWGFHLHRVRALTLGGVDVFRRDRSWRTSSSLSR